MWPLAHGIGSRSDLPVPLWLAQYGGAAALVISFVILVAFWRLPRFEDPDAGRPLPGLLQRVVDAPLTRALLRLLGLAMGAAVVLVAVLGPPNPATNPAPTWLYVWFWVGLVPASLLLGPVWRALNPLRTLTMVISRVAGDRDAELARPLPPGLGYWPAVAGLLAFVWLELVYQNSALPLTVGWFLLAYGAANLFAGALYGPAWHDRGDAFEVYSTLLGHLAPVGRRSDGRLVLRNPLRGLSSLEDAPGLVAFVCALLGSTAFDGLTRTQLWTNLTLTSGPLANALIGTAGLLAMVALVYGVYVLAVRASSRYLPRAQRQQRNLLEARFVPSLLPIAVGYTIAHYFSLLLFQGQAGYILASDPLGDGWNLFGTADWQIGYTVVSTATIALVQVAAIVTGHVLGVVVAHDRAVGTFPEKAKTDAQYPLLVVMVTYTTIGIALLVGA
ncbi:MAG TPA: hypothetical protein VFL71_15920 [Actinomycetes bacterium]|jgi:hypothetical protein|nr:hypothetical protein [Actinomycetes bacterium]